MLLEVAVCEMGNLFGWALLQVQRKHSFFPPQREVGKVNLKVKAQSRGNHYAEDRRN